MVLQLDRLFGNHTLLQLAQPVDLLLVCLLCSTRLQLLDLVSNTLNFILVLSFGDQQVLEADIPEDAVEFRSQMHPDVLLGCDKSFLVKVGVVLSLFVAGSDVDLALHVIIQHTFELVRDVRKLLVA